MLHEIILGDKTIVAIGLPEDSTDILLLDDGDLYYKSNFHGLPVGHLKHLPKGLKLIGIYPDINDDDYKEIIEEHKVAKNNYMDYRKNYFNSEWIWTCSTSKESFESLMQREKLYTVNPYGNHFHDYVSKLGLKGDLSKAFDKYQEAEARTFKKWALLVKID